MANVGNETGTLRAMCIFFSAVSALCACSCSRTQTSAEEERRTALIKKFIAICEDRPRDYSKGEIVYIKYCRNGNSPEIVVETKSAKGKEPALTPEKREAVRVECIEQVGRELSVGDIAEYGRYGIVVTMRGLSHDGKELYRIPVQFARMMEHWGHASLFEYHDAHSGATFSHTRDLSIRQERQAGGEAVHMAFRKRPIGGLKIGPPFPAKDLKLFIASGKEHYRTKYNASSVEYELITTPLKIPFHHIKAEVTIKGVAHVIDRFVHMTDVRSFSFEFLVAQEQYAAVSPEIATMINTFCVPQGRP